MPGRKMLEVGWSEDVCFNFKPAKKTSLFVMQSMCLFGFVFGSFKLGVLIAALCLWKISLKIIFNFKKRMLHKKAGLCLLKL